MSRTTTLSFCFCLLSLLVPGFAPAAPSATDPAVVKVRKGDTLFAIAHRNGLSVKDLKHLNRLGSDLIHPGQRLRLALPREQPAGAEKTACGGEDPLADAACDYLAIPYRLGGNDLSGIDCSALVQRFFRPLGIELPRTAREQFRLGHPVDPKDLASGDLLFFHTYAPYASHVGIYLGEGHMLHASSRSHRVVISAIANSYFRQRLLGARRLLDPIELQEQLQLTTLDLPQEEAASDPLATLPGTLPAR
ncbi:C40 family peptidase [Desulfuromonas carbonis]|uniref:C40 family peptidase n=1 Tax=Desulfuromonas sp. DDH964 TaxID=1823759 RepID=UPI00078ECF3B|nr:LysM peptidoglycan-binding domain-containing C40 family peptidase [Desulfuromonas sp. DDH964]AMV72800.1 hypothetical protein DBW_2470 [Desulfuromonas sp. DDH964]